MNFRRIFLVKCLLLLFPNVKGADTRRIYVAVNGSAFLNIMTAGTVHEVTWSRNDMRLLQIKNKKIKYYTDSNGCRCKVHLNGTLQIQQLIKEDSGTYTVLVYHDNGKLKAEEKTALIVQEPVPQPTIYAECINKTTVVKCEVKQKTKTQTFTIEVAHGETKTSSNLTKVELTTHLSGRFRCTVKNEISKKTTEKEIKCSGQLDFYLIVSIAGGAILFVTFVILLIYCIRKKKTERLEDDAAGQSESDSGLPDEERMMQIRKVDTEMVVRELPRPPANPTPRQVRVQQRPLPQPQGQQQAVPPWPRPRTQPRTPNQPKERP